MLKVFALLKRKPGMSMDEFIDYYENHHAPLGVEILKTARHYARHYLHSAADPVSGDMTETDYDVVTELHFDDRQGYDDFMAMFADPVLAKRVGDDEDRLFDRAKNKLVFVTTYESDMS